MRIPFWVSRSFVVSLALLSWSFVLKLDASPAVDLKTVQTMVAGGKITELRAVSVEWEEEVLPSQTISEAPTG